MTTLYDPLRALQLVEAILNQFPVVHDGGFVLRTKRYVDGVVEHTAVLGPYATREEAKRLRVLLNALPFRVGLHDIYAAYRGLTPARFDPMTERVHRIGVLSRVEYNRHCAERKPILTVK